MTGSSFGDTGSYELTGRDARDIEKRMDMIAALASRYSGKQYRIQFIKMIEELADKKLYHHLDAMRSRLGLINNRKDEGR